jgi:hypothetical protein
MMKKRSWIACLAALALAAAGLLFADTFRVTAASLAVSPADFSGPCPHTFTFTARITVNMPGTVRWKILTGDGTLGGEESTVFAAAGTQTQVRSHAIGADRRSVPDGWARLVILSPGSLQSASAAFALNCVTIEAQSKMYMPMFGKIRGTASPFTPGGSLGGRRVVVVVSGPTPARREFALDANGSLQYEFDGLRWGRYTVRIEKGASDPGSYASSANYCFDGTDPASRTVDLERSRSTLTVENFLIRASIAFDRSGWCW